MSKRRGSSDVEDFNPKRVAVENRDTSPLSVSSGYDAEDRDRIERDDLVPPAADSHTASPPPPRSPPPQTPIVGSIAPPNVSKPQMPPRVDDPDSSNGLPPAPSEPAQPENFIYLRILLTAHDAVELIGRRGATIARVKEASNVRISVSDNFPGAQERIVNIRGAAEHVAKAAGLVVRILREEPFDVPSVADGKPFGMRLLFPNSVMGALIGRGGSKFREIEEASAAKIKAMEQVLPFSTDRCIRVLGVADAIHIAVYYLAMTYLAHKESANIAGSVHYDPARAASQNMPPFGEQRYSAPQNQSRDRYGRNGSSGNGAPGRYEVRAYDGPDRRPAPYSNRGPSSQGNRPVEDPRLQQALREAQDARPDQELSQQLHVQESLVGSLIGKGGSTINEIRRVSKSQIRVQPSSPASEDRLVILQGTASANETAIRLISDRLEYGKNRHDAP